MGWAELVFFPHLLRPLFLYPLILTFALLSSNIKVDAQEVDLELVLAMDGSGSISETEFKLQLIGTAAAFRDPSVQQAIQSGPHGRIAVSLLIWSDAAFEKFTTPWYVLDTPTSANQFANLLQGYHQQITRRLGIGGGGTGIGSGVAFALDMIRANEFQGLRKVIDVSGDGTETDPWFKKAIKLPGALERARAQNVTVNGLAILTDFVWLDTYYRENVVSGPGSFVIRADGFEDYAGAILEKLNREIRYAPLSLLYMRGAFQAG